MARADPCARVIELVNAWDLAKSLPAVVPERFDGHGAGALEQGQWEQAGGRLVHYLVEPLGHKIFRTGPGAQRTSQELGGVDAPAFWSVRQSGPLDAVRAATVGRSAAAHRMKFAASRMQAAA